MASADAPIRLRDEIPADWTASGESVAGVETADAPDGRTFVYFAGSPAKETNVAYDATAPDAPETATFGPLQAREENGTWWVDVPGTATDETVETGS